MEQVLSMVLLFASAVSSSQLRKRIVGGVECKPHSQPWQVFLFDASRNRCGGALIEESWVLTAGHCLGNSLTAHLGKHDLRTHNAGEQHSKAVKTIRNPGFDPLSLYNDIMLVRLDPPAILGDTVKTVPIAKACASHGTQCTVSGWGTTAFPKVNYAHTLQCMDTNIMPKDVCKSIYGTYFSDTEICAGRMEGGTDSCQGDSGSPLVCNGVLHGVVSWGALRCAAKQHPAIFTEICKFRDWIEETVAAN